MSNEQLPLFSPGATWYQRRIPTVGQDLLLVVLGPTMQSVIAWVLCDNQENLESPCPYQQLFGRGTAGIFIAYLERPGDNTWQCWKICFGTFNHRMVCH